MSKPEPEKRRARRYPMKLPATVQVKNGSVRDVPCETRDVSQSGMFLYTDSEVHEGSEIEIVAMLPPELVPQSTGAWVCCHARVVRVEDDPNSGRGIAAVIERFGVVPEA